VVGVVGVVGLVGVVGVVGVPVGVDAWQGVREQA
jgi:hypothetical protein